MENLKEKANAAGEEIKESVKQGAVDLIDDAASFKHSVDEIAADRNEAKAEKKAEKREKFDEKEDELKKALE